jgi:DNA-directed RNA polymerase subunit M/transcription elongation factor TFIIS
MSDRTIVYQTFYNPIEANIVLARLQDSGIACFLADENISTIQPLYNQAVGGVKLIVFERDRATVDSILSEKHDISLDEDPTSPDGAIEDDELTCENCGSHNVSFGQATKRRFSSWVMFFSMIFSVYPFKSNNCFHCHDCGHEFV